MQPAGSASNELLYGDEPRGDTQHAPVSTLLTSVFFFFFFFSLAPSFFSGVMDHTMHPECWQCSKCHTALKAENCAFDSGVFWCRPCLSEKRKTGAPAAQQVQQQMGSNPQAVPAATQAQAQAAVAPAAAASGSVEEKGQNALAGIKARQEIEKAQLAAAAAAGASSTPAASQYSDPTSVKYSYSQLKDRESKPADVDPARREQYLSDIDFQTHFKMNREEFAKLPDWKKKKKKKKTESTWVATAPSCVTPLGTSPKK